MKKTLIALLLINSVLLTGCISSITAISLNHDKNKNKAIPYYLPQPYLLITQDFSHHVTKTTKKQNEKPEAEPNEPSIQERSTITEPVSITFKGYTYTIIYLPNLAEKYGLIYNSGSGESELSFTLKDGWMFTGLNLKSDAQIDETITAISSLVGNIAKIVEPSALKIMLGDQVKEVSKPSPAIWLFKMTIKDNKITFEPVILDFDKQKRL
jgi:hypothetical protein